jgi:hypothetical protein
VDGDEQVGLGVVGNLGASVQCNECIFLTGVDYIHILAIFLDQITQFQGYIQVDVFLFAFLADGTGIFASVSGVND